MSETGGQSPEPQFNPQSGFPEPTPEQPSAPPPPTPYGQPSPPTPYGQQYPTQGYPQPYGQQQYAQPYAQPYAQQPYYAGQKAPGESLYVAAAIINWVVLGLIVLATLGIGIIAAAWFIPMTIRMHKDARDHTKHTALGVCTLLFCNLISGVLILVGDSERRAA